MGGLLKFTPRQSVDHRAPAWLCTSVVAVPAENQRKQKAVLRVTCFRPWKHTGPGHMLLEHVPGTELA